MTVILSKTLLCAGIFILGIITGLVIGYLRRKIIAKKMTVLKKVIKNK